MTDPLFSVADQIILVSGASRGIGKAIARGFSERDAQVVITGRDEHSLRQAATEISLGRHSSLPIVCDVADRDQIDRLVQNVLERFGRIDTLVNVAGVNRRKPALDVTAQDYEFVMKINLDGAYWLSLAVGRSMIERRGGSQINVTSLNNERPLKNVSPYAMSKAAMGQMTRALALEWGPSNVRVNALAPGFVLTDLTEKLWSDPEMQQWGRTNTPLARLGVPEDMIGTAVFLASPAARFLTGQIIYVDGGFTCGWNWPIPPVSQ